MKQPAIFILALLLAGSLSGCLVGPNYHPPAMQLPAAYKEAPGWVQANPADSQAKGDWWLIYNDPILNQLEPQVAVRNQTLAADYAAYEQAVELADEERGQLFPTLGLTGSATREGSGSGSSSASTGTSSGTGTGTVTTTSTSSFSTGPRTSGSFEGEADWTPDIWGKIRRQLQSDKAAAQVTAADLANATLSEQALLATDYIDLRAADSDITLLQQTVSAYQRSLTITQNQLNAGVASPLDIITARTQLEGAQAQLENAGIARAQYEHAIAVLMGQAPAALTLPPGTLPANIPHIPAGVPATILQRRPDIAAAERAMAENNADIGVAVGAFYPDISLSALGGYTADPIAGLFSVSNAIWSLGTNATQSLFAGGSHVAAVRAASFGYQGSVANYRQTVLTALQQVEDELANLRILAAQAQDEQAAVTDAARAVQIALNEYTAGTQAYTTVVTAQATLFADQQSALTIQQNRLAASIALIQALGGGWQTADLPPG